MSIQPPPSGSTTTVATADKKELFREIGLGVLYSAIFGSFIYEPLGYFYDRLAAVQDFSQLRELSAYLLSSTKVWLFLLLLVFFCIDYLYSHLLIPKYNLGHLFTDCITLVVMGLSFKAVHLHQSEAVNIRLLMYVLAFLLTCYIVGNAVRIFMSEYRGELKRLMFVGIIGEVLFVVSFILAARFSRSITMPVVLILAACVAYALFSRWRKKKGT